MFYYSLCLSKIKIFEERTLLVNGEKKKLGSKSLVDFYGPRLPYEHIKLFIPKIFKYKDTDANSELIKLIDGYLKARVSATSCPTHFLS